MTNVWKAILHIKGGDKENASFLFVVFGFTGQKLDWKPQLDILVTVIK